MNEIRTRIGKGGRVVVPAATRRRLGLRPGDEVIVIEEPDGLRILSPAQAVERSRRLVRAHVPRGRRLASELLRDRRREARRG